MGSRETGLSHKGPRRQMLELEKRWNESNELLVLDASVLKSRLCL